MITQRSRMQKHGKPLNQRANRRAFLRGVGGVALGLPFLEGLPERSAWAQNDTPVFMFFMVAACGVVKSQFFPGATGPITTASLQGETKAVSALAEHAANLLFVDGINYPGRLTNCGHAQGLVQSLTGAPVTGGGPGSQSTGISADMLISGELNPSGVDPLTLYGGSKFYVAERISFSGPGNARPAERNPYNVYRSLVGLVGNGGDDMTDPDEVEGTANQLVLRENSINDLVRDDLESLLARSDLSAADRDRLDAHLTAVREIEMDMGSIGTTSAKRLGSMSRPSRRCKTSTIKPTA